MTAELRSALGTAILALAVTLAALFALSWGMIAVPASEVLGALVGTADSGNAQIVRELRLPRVATAIIAGGALGIGGVLMQALFRNPMADAWSLGLTAGGQLGVALLVTAAAFAGPEAIGFLRNFEGVSITAGAMLGIGVFAFAMVSLARRVSTVTLLVVGLMLGFTVQGIVSVVIHFANRVGGRVFSGWNDGNFASVTSADLPMLLVPVLAGVLLALANAKPLTALLLGETYARSLGTDVRRLRWLTLAAVVLLVAPVTAYCGPVTFVGLIVPHIARAIAGTARILPLMPLAALAGALMAEVVLLPAGIEYRYTARELAYAIATELHAPLNLPVLKYLKDPLGHSQDEIDTWYRHWLARTLTPVERRLEQLGSGDFLFDAPGLFEVVLLPQVYNARRFAFDFSAMPRIEAIEAACLALPAFQRAHPDNQPDNPENN
ncbi:iron chelate uptake ABC transporter family permease subunit [Leptolyngbya sp. 15MV]|nr:iron chelate uptake ABC transporter family permease subunit [Leptolyngbya sp. 15MV]